MLLISSHLLAAIVAYATIMPTVTKSVLFILILLSLLYYLARDVLRVLSGAWVGMLPDANGVLVTTRDGKNFVGHIENKTVVCPYFVVLRVTREGSCLPVSRAIFPDALDEGVFRELCVRLKFTRESEPSAAGLSIFPGNPC